jgi:hypothetical protein
MEDTRTSFITGSSNGNSGRDRERERQREGREREAGQAVSILEPQADCHLTSGQRNSVTYRKRSAISITFLKERIG